MKALGFPLLGVRWPPLLKVGGRAGGKAAGPLEESGDQAVGESQVEGVLLVGVSDPVDALSASCR